MLRKIGLICIVLLGLLFAVRQVRRHIGPNELGFHDTQVHAEAQKNAHDAPRIGNCEIFPADNVWNTAVDRLPAAPKSGAYVDSIGPLKKVHPDFGADMSSGIPFSDIPSGTPRVHVVFENTEESDLGNYPIPADAPVEGGNANSEDRHILLIDQQRCLLYELYAAKPQPDGSWQAGSGIKMDLTDNALRTDGKTSADAAGLPILPGLVRYEEVQSGEIRHALRFTVPKTQAAYVWPARHKASRLADVNFPPMGTRFRLRADFNASGFSKSNQVIITALKKYGMLLADNGGAMFISGVPDKRWSDSDLHNLGNIKAEDFEAVDESDWQMLADSARVDPVRANK